MWLVGSCMGVVIDISSWMQGAMQGAANRKAVPYTT